MKKIFIILAIAFGAISFTGCVNTIYVPNRGEEFKLLSLDDLRNTDEKIIVQFWHSFGHNIQEALNPLIEDFELMMAEEGIELRVRAESVGGGYDGLRSRVNMGIRSGAIPTMLLGYPDHFANYIDNNIMLPLDEFANSEDPEIGLENTYEGELDFVQSYWDECFYDVTFNGTKEKRLMSVPFNKSTEIMIYNSTVVDPILKEKGYISDLSEVWSNPTWEQVMSVSQAIKDKIAAGLNWTYKGSQYKVNPKDALYPVLIDSTSNFFITTARQWGGADSYTRINATTGEGEAVFNNNQVASAWSFFKPKMEANLWQIPDKVNQSYGSAPFLNRHTFITIGSTAGIKNNISKSFDVKATTYPQKEYGEGANNAVIQQGTNAAILTSNSNNITRLAAWQLIRFLTDTSNTTIFSKATGYLPVRHSAYNSISYQNFLKGTDDPVSGSVAKAVIAANNQTDYLFTDQPFIGSSIVRDKVGVVTENICLRKYTFENAVKQAYDELKKLRVNTV